MLMSKTSIKNNNGRHSAKFAFYIRLIGATLTTCYQRKEVTNDYNDYYSIITIRSNSVINMGRILYWET